MANEMSTGAFIRTTSFFTLISLAVVTIASWLSYGWAVNGWLDLLLFIVGVVMIFVFTGSDNPVISFIGVNGLAGIVGLIVGPCLKMYSADGILTAAILSLLTVAVFSVLGIIFGAFFRGIGGIIIGALNLLVIVVFGQAILAAFGLISPYNFWISAGAIVVFMGVTAYDWAIALAGPLTLDKAIDTSGGLMLDVVNIFLRILEILGNSSSSSSSSLLDD